MKQRLGEKLAACLLALTVAAPMCYVMQLSLGIGISGWYAFWFATGSLLLLELSAWNRVTAVAVPAGLALFAGFIWLVAGENGREALSDFYSWAVGFLSRADVYPLGYGVALTAIASFLVTTFVWLFGRKFFFFPVVLAFVAAFVLKKWLDGLDTVVVPGALACGGLLLLWAKSYQRETEKKTKQTLPVNGIALYLLPVAALLVLFGLTSATTESSRNWQNRSVNDAFERVNNYLADFTNFNRPRNVYSIAAYGLMPMGDRLGGPIKPPDFPVMYVSAPRSMLLRGMVYNNYTGSKWTDTTDSPTYRLDSTHKPQSDNAFDVNRPELKGTMRLDYKRYVESATISVKPLIESASTLFVPVRGVTAITSDKFLGILPKFNTKGEAFNSVNIHAGYGYKVKADSLMYNQSGFDALMERLMAMKLSDTAEQENYIRSNYLGLPDHIYLELYTLTKDIVSGKTISVVRYKNVSINNEVTTWTESSFNSWSYPAARNDYEKALAIKEYLMKFYSYTLSPGIPDENQDFVSQFVINEPYGYCTYFASAMAVMARIAGIPSRYAEGYALPGEPGPGGEYTVTGENAHAWAELYFSGIGWVPFDATPAAESGENQGGNPDIPTYTPPPTPRVVGEVHINETGAETFSWDDILPYAWILPAALAAAALLWVIARMVRYKVRISFRDVMRRYGDLRLSCAFYYCETLKLLEYYSYPVKKGETPYAYAARIDKWLRLEFGTFAEAANLISLLSYSDYKPVAADADYMMKYRGALAKYTYHTVGPWYYLWHCVLGFGRKPSPRKGS